MQLENLTAVSPIDGRYAGKCAEFREIFSEYGLIKRRVAVECAWLEALCAEPGVAECAALGDAERESLRAIAEGFSLSDARRVKEIEATTNHDVKAVECFLKEKVAGTAELESSGGVYSVFAGIQEKLSFLPDYAFPGSESAAGTTISGLVGALIVAALCVGVCLLFRFFRNKKAAAG